MLDPSLLDPNVMVAAQNAGFDHVVDLNHNGKLDIQDVALMQSTQTTPVCQEPAVAVV